ncbi:hypothetical protein [Protaetiibacter mangrovi]|uniref:Uncharacterized protein n=1 Tax=Protaetiibacter mangrovi TaxID=2970926 RepID=A0ABT1ZDG0_9MICO|nr:hypothetical protein [Protaetiibacter mangrovi]MCS0498741.1 hypothetical protein [Protaetiibacter mangrovi]TPX03423.1 hypothetical protein FJ656_17260 [Schumannella luteola]
MTDPLVSEESPVEQSPAEVDAVEPPAAAPRESFFKRRIWTRTGKIIAAVVSAVSFVTGVIGVIPILTRDATGLGSLEVSAAPFEAGPREYALPPDAELSSFPTGAACGPEQLAWLEANAAPLTHRVVLDMGNHASEGSMLALTELRAVTTGVAGDLGVRVVCDSPAQNVQSARLFVDQPGATAYFGGDTFGGSGRPDSPVAWNLAPGENGTLVVDLLSATAVGGSLQFTAHSGTESTTIDIEGSDFVLPPLAASGAQYLLATADGFVCRALDGSECDLTALLAG